MSSLKFRFKDQDGDLASDESYEFQICSPPLRTPVLEEIALGRPPCQPDEPLAAEVLNADGIAVARVGLTISVDFFAA